MPVNAVPVTLYDGLGALAGGTSDTAGATATSLAQRITSAIGAVFVTNPILTGDKGAGAFVRGLGNGSERTRANKRVKLIALRNDDAGGAIAGAFSVHGVNLPDALSGKPVGDAYSSTAAETVLVARNASAVALSGSTTVDASSLSTDAIDAGSTGFNWLVVLNGQILPYAAAALANVPSWSIAAGVVTLRAGTAAGTIPAGSDIVVYKLAPTELLASGAHSAEFVGLQSYDILFTRWGTNQGASDRTVIAIDHLAE